MSKQSTPLLGRLAVQLKLITLDQLAEATRDQVGGMSARQLGEIFVAKGWITEKQLLALIKRQNILIERHRAKQAEESGAGRPSIATVTDVSGPPPEALDAPSAPVEAAGTGTAPTAPPAPSPKTAPAPNAAPSPAPAKPPAPAAPAAAPPRSEARATVVDVTDADRERLAAVLADGVNRGASDIHVHSGAPLKLRINGCMQTAGDQPLDPGATERMLFAALRPDQREHLVSRGELDLPCCLEGVGRFRANLYRQQRGYDGVFRFVPPAPPTLEELGLPMNLAKHTGYHQGMVLLTGPTGCGKSSTMAALVDLINQERTEHILTIEDPIEFVHQSKRCLVNQRSVDHHTQSFDRALRAALREDPDIIVIGELRDLETISLALTAAETGHFVLGTLHTDSTIRTINRLVGVFPSDQQEQVRNMLSESLRAVVSQRLLPRKDGSGRVPATETLVVNKAIGNLIRENKAFQIHSILQTGASQGMGLLDHSLRDLVKEGAVSMEDALLHCEEPKNLGA